MFSNAVWSSGDCWPEALVAGLQAIVAAFSHCVTTGVSYLSEECMTGEGINTLKDMYFRILSHRGGYLV